MKVNPNLLRTSLVNLAVTKKNIEKNGNKKPAVLFFCFFFGSVYFFFVFFFFFWVAGGQGPFLKTARHLFIGTWPRILRPRSPK